MKFLKFLLPVVALLGGSSVFNLLEAQSLSELQSLTWKTRSTALQALDTGHSDAVLMEQALNQPAGMAAVKFREIAYNQVRNNLENGQDFPEAIFNGYELAIERMAGQEPMYDKNDKEVRRSIFDEITNILKN